MKITKALITSAGFGTRFLPLTKTVQKEMLPVLNKPMIEYVVDDCVKAGIEEIIFVVKEGEMSLVEHFYTESDQLEKYLEKMDKLEKCKDFVLLHKDIKFSFVEQKIDDDYGTAIPLKLARDYLENEEAFLVFMGDDFIYSLEGVSQASEMIKLFNDSNSKGLVTCIEKPDEELYRYGVAEVVKKDGFEYLTNLIEKPETGTAPSNLINISKYIFTPEIFDVIENQFANESNGEFYITDSATILAKDNPVVIFKPKARYLDGGNVINWLKANLIVAKNTPEIKDELTSFIREEFK